MNWCMLVVIGAATGWAVSHIDAALKEIGEAEKWARAHHDIK
jgi:hypothetical protein